MQILDHGAVEASLPLCGWPAACDRRSKGKLKMAATSAPVGPNRAAPLALPLVVASRPIPDRVAGEAEIVGAVRSPAYRLVHCFPVSARYSPWASSPARVPVTPSSTHHSATSSPSSLAANSARTGPTPVPAMA